MTVPAHRRTGPRGGFVLLAVLVVVAAAILVATGAIFTARATTSVARASAADARLREAALDGVAIAADRIARQRLSILRGDAPEVEETLVVRGDGIESIEVTLAPLSDGALVESEAAKLDLNRADPATLAALAAELGPDAPEVVDAFVRARPVASLDGAVEALPEAMRLRALRTVLGPLRTLENARGADDPTGAGLVAAIGVHAREALVDNTGAPRLDVVATFGGGDGDAFPAAAIASFDDGEVAALREVVASFGAAAGTASASAGSTPDDGRLASALLARGVAIGRVASILGQCTLHQGALAPARLDVLRADERVLAAFDGLGREAAERIVELRSTLDADERASTAWLVSRRVLEAGAYARIAGRLSHRSTSWRFRVVARLAPAETAGDESAGAGASGAVAAFDCIVDVAAEPPRLVFLRDVSMLPTARSLALSLVERSAREGLPAARGGDFGDVDARDASAPAPLVPVEVPEPTVPRVDSQRGSATMDPVRVAPVRPRTDPTGRDVGGGG